ncbi:TlyA family RNA methyltransferase [Cellulomonas bogoriensis]|uniref:Cytochrome C peroxidase n=1 Tax=Cellulomonas bogoriensis 69B4 = DSM 16987 TaxID=1386082 RepID=A0A0A0BN71_9CELL|nr:TlyA family RNA methyltransferase [Cellulomonas bogoriensis]KGM09360.1 cytochrome C peroxidase [Cellulomonas bogoriensis 69B4 = DSM 16987]
MPERLDVELVRRGLVRSRTRACALITAGGVVVDGDVATRPAQHVGTDVPITVTQPDEMVSRGGHKLKGALEQARLLTPGALDVDGRYCLDAGASTGGFTQVLLDEGARHVLAVDVGHGQLAPELTADPRVTLKEGQNVRELERALVPTPPDLLVADLSFISLTLVLPALLDVGAPGCRLLVLVKPQFEVGRGRARHGVVTDDAARTEAVLGVAAAARAHGAAVRGVLPSVLPGENGNREIFLWLEQGGQQEGDVTAAVTAAVTTDLPGAVS